ncbi:MAG: GyrI-like domain-containing protein [Planctomycetota bacterium]
MLEVNIQELPALRVAAVRHVGPFQELGPAFEAVCGWAGRKGLFGPDTRVVGVFHDDPRTTAPADLRSDAAVTVAEGVEGDAESGIGIAEVPGGTYAVAILVGPYEKLPEAYAWLADTWLPGSGRAFAMGPSYEVYLNDASQTPPEELRTAIHLPLQP